MALVLITGAQAQTPRTGLTYTDRSGTTGHTLTLGGKSFGPYREVSAVVPSTSGTSGLFLVVRRDRVYALTQTGEWGPLGQGFDWDQAWVSDDGQVWAMTALRDLDEEEGTYETLLVVNGKTYGPYASVYGFEYSETGGKWLAIVENGLDSYEVLFNGEAQGSATSVEHAWVAPDGRGWGWVMTDQGQTTVVTQDRRYEDVVSVNIDQMYPRDPHWALGVRLTDDEELIIIDGKDYPGYLNFSGLYLTYSGRHWGFSAEKLTDKGDYPVVVIDGKEYVGEGLGSFNLGEKEAFTWSVTEGDQVRFVVLPLP